MSSSASELFRQRTVRRAVSITGLGIHTGNRTTLTLHPAPVNSGLRFRRVDAKGVEIPAHMSQVTSLDLATTLGRDDVTVSTVEHLMAAIHIMGIDNLVIDVDGPEVPILDGSSIPYIHLLQAVGVQQQDAWRRILVATSPLSASAGDKHIQISPHPGLRISYRIDFANAGIGHQEIDLQVDRESFIRELAPARTFGLWSDVQMMRDKGLGLGGTSENCVVFDETGPMNTELRFDDEPVRHKALDAVGDLALFGAPIWGHVEVERGGHLVHYRLLEVLRDNPDCWTWVTSERARWPAKSGARVDSDRRRILAQLLADQSEKRPAAQAVVAHPPTREAGGATR